MRRIFITILVVALFTGSPTLGNAADRNYIIENCDRSILWPAILKDLETRDPATSDFVKNNVKIPKEKPRLTADDLKQIQYFDPKLHWHVSECILLMKEINQFVSAVHKFGHPRSWDVSMEIEGTLNIYDIPFISIWDKTKKYVFLVNFSKLRPHKNF